MSEESQTPPAELPEPSSEVIPFPAYRYGPEGQRRTVTNQAEADALGPDWSDTPRATGAREQPDWTFDDEPKKVG